MRRIRDNGCDMGVLTAAERTGASLNEMLTFVCKAKWKVRIIQLNSATNLN